ncbi:MAG: GDSL-type esterase/lipase family protein, partial [Nitriliruptoraceae bacterium]
MLGGRQRRVLHMIFVVALTVALLPSMASRSVSANPAEQVRILPLGDSITAGDPGTPDPQPTYRMYLYDHLVASGLAAGTGFDLVGRYNEHPSSTYDFLRQEEWDHDSESVSGKRTLWASQVVGGAVRDFEPEVVLVLIGINDLRQDITPQEAAANIEEVVDKARFDPDVDIVLAEIPPAAGFEALVEEYNALVREVAASTTTSTSRVVSVDLYTGFDLEVYSYDGVHPNSAGDEWIAERFADVLHTEFGIGDPWGGEPEPVAPTTTIT